MSGIVAAAQSSGCCCRPVPCQCNSWTRPGAYADRSRSMVRLSCDISIDWRKRRNGGSLNGWCGSPCRCVPDLDGAGIYRYQQNGNRLYNNKVDICLGCTTTACASCSAYSINASMSGSNLALLLGGPSVSDPYIFETRTSNVLDQVIGNWNWAARRVGYCTDPDNHPWRVRKTCVFDPVYGAAGGLIPLVSVDPNGAYIGQDGEYTQGRWGTNIGAIYAVGGATIRPPGPVTCDYTLTIRIIMKSLAALLDSYADFGPGPIDATRIDPFGGGYSVVEYTYIKPCRAGTDEVFGTYELTGQADFDFYDEDPQCGPVAFLEEYRFSAAPTAEVS